MATLSRFSSPSPPPPPSFSNSNPNPSSNPKPNPEYVSPMLQKYLDQQDHQELGPPGIEEVEHEIRHDSVTHRDLNSGHISSSTPNSNNDHVDRPLPTVFHLSFNQDYGCFTLGTDRGFRIYNCEPFKLLFRRESDNGGGIGNVEMLFRCNIVALVGGGDNPQYPPTKLMIWDDHQGQCIGELTFRSEVRGVRLRKDRIVVVLELKIFVYNFRDLKVLHQIETVSNPRGLCEVSQVAGSFVLVCPGLQKGQVRVEHYASKRTKFILAHDSSLACFTLSRDGNLLATTSTKGTLVRIFNTQDGSLLQEVRRGVDRAEIHSLAFSSCSQWLAVSSDKGTIHVFSLKINLGNLGSENSSSPHDSEFSRASSSSSLSFIKGVLPKYFSSEWSVAQFRLPEGSRYIAAFGHEKNTVIVVGLDGSFYVCKFDPGAVGEMTQLAYHNFLKPTEGSQQ